MFHNGIKKTGVGLAFVLAFSGLGFSAPTNEELNAKIEALADELEASQQDKQSSKTHLGGYGELHYNNLSAKGSGSDKKEIDFHRFVLFIGHEFSDRINLHTELEVEHAFSGEGKPGGVELEQAYVDFVVGENLKINAGVFLVPVGIVNETHEPPTFYGVERNPVEKNIIPATWWEAGVGVSGEVSSNWSYDFNLTSGLNTSLGNNYSVRSGRQKVAKAQAKDLALTGRLKYRARWGEWSTTLQSQGDVTQGADANAGGATLFSTHVIYRWDKFSVTGLYATWSLSGSGPSSVGADEQTGYYIEPSYKVCKNFGVFARYNIYDNKAGDSADSEKSQTNIGFNYWPHEDVVVKLDYEDQNFESGNTKERKGFNLGLGYQF